MEPSFADFSERSRLSEAKDLFKKLGRSPWGALGLAAIGTLAVGDTVAALHEIAPSPRELVCLAREQFHEPAPRTRFTILISNRAGDADGRQTR
jgi:hypothetical protein